jgi:hypothetical protein
MTVAETLPRDTYSESSAQRLRAQSATAAAANSSAATAAALHSQRPM